MAAIPSIKAVPIASASSVAPSKGIHGSRTPFSEVLSGKSFSRQGGTSLQQAAGGVMGDLEAGRKRLDEIIAQARAGKTFKPGQLLAMQAEVDYIGEQMALSQHLVSEAVSCVKRMWSMQV